MTFIYIFMILLSAFPVLLTSWRMRRAAMIKKNGIHTDAIVTKVKSIRLRHSPIDILTLEYKDRATGQSFYGKATVHYMRNKPGDRITVAYLPDKPATYAVADTKKGFTGILIFTIILFLFMLFAVYKIDEMVRTGQM